MKITYQDAYLCMQVEVLVSTFDGTGKTGIITMPVFDLVKL